MLLLFVLILNGCDNRSDVSDELYLGYINPYETPINITIYEAEQIALEQAHLDKLDSPEISKHWETIVHSVYSVKYDRDVLVYWVYIKTAALPPEEIMFNEVYFISTDNGEVIVTNE